MSLGQLALITMVAAPGAVGILLALTRTQRFAPWLPTVAAMVTTALSILIAFDQPTVSYRFMAGADFAVAIDPLAALTVPMITTVTTLVLIFSARNIRQSPARFHGLMLFFASSALLTATAASLPALLLAWELMGAASYLLIGFWWQETNRVSAGLTAFITTRSADLGLYLAAGAALGAGIGMGLSDLATAPGPWRHVMTAGIIIAALGKAAQLPFSFWLSGAMQGPSPVSALLHSAAMVAMGGYLLLRMQPLLVSTAWAGPTTAGFGLLSAVLLGIVALGQRDFKQLLAASTAAQLGLVIFAAGLGAVSAGATHLVAHGAVKAMLFLVAGIWLTLLRTQKLSELQGAAHRFRLVGVTATIALLSLAGVAPLALWATKDAVLGAALETSAWWYAGAMVAVVLSGAYAGKIVWFIWRRAAPRHNPSSKTVTAAEQIPLTVFAVGAVVLGVLALPPIHGQLTDAMGGFGAPSVIELVSSAVIAAAILLLMLRIRIPEPRWARSWLGLEATTHTVVVRPTLAIANGLAWFDDHVLDRAVQAAAIRSRIIAQAVARADDGVVDGAVNALTGRVRWLGQAARKPQTGAIHHYFVQVVTVLTIGVVAWALYVWMW